MEPSHPSKHTEPERAPVTRHDPRPAIRRARPASGLSERMPPPAVPTGDDVAPPSDPLPDPLPTAALPNAVLSDITHLLVSEDSLDRVLEAVADALAELVPHDTLIVFEADAPLRVLRPVLARDAYAEQILAMGPIAYGTGITGMAAESAVPQLANDAHADPRAAQIPGTPNDPESMLAIPLVARDDMNGVLCLYRLGEENHFTIKEFKLAIVFSELAALAIDNAQIRTRLEAEVVTDHLTALYNHRFFHERLAEELRRCSRNRSNLALVIYDIDDFKRVNDTHGHLVGDQILQGVASVSRETCRLEDVICRIGGEEFAVIVPGATVAEATALGNRLREAISGMLFPKVGRLTVSVGVAEGPLHSSSPRELIACADLALLEAKACGKDQVRVYARAAGDSRADDLLVAERINGHARDLPGVRVDGQGRNARLATLTARGELRSVAHLRTLQSLSTQLNKLNDVREIGEVITAELRALIDYHNCRVFVLDADGETLLPIAFRGSLSEYEGETFEMLVMKVGEGLTGHAAQSGESYYTPDAANDPYAETIAGTDDIDESILAVPLKYGDRLVGIIVLSKLGIDQFDDEDRRLLEALASNAAVAVENARLLHVEHEAAEVSRRLLGLSQALTRVQEVDAVLEETVGAIPAMVSCASVGAWIRDAATGGFRLVRHRGVDPSFDPMLAGREVPRDTAEEFLESTTEPFVMPKEVVASVPDEYRALKEPRECLVAPMHWEPDGLGAFVVVAPAADARFSERDVELARGIADITSLALGNAHRFVELERAYFSTVEALANAVEAKDEYTSDHCRALAEMSMRVGAEMGLSGETLKVLELGALFHDIGKIGVPSDVIRKPGPLTAAERREMNRHPEIGSQILAPVPFLQPVRPVIEASHERWDGHGYPNGLAREEIPLAARIVFVCDAFHAMTSDRPYRAALPEKEAIRRLKLSAGTQFDPEVVDAFVALHASGRIHAH